MAQDDIPGVVGAPGDPGGHQGAPGGSWLLLAAKRVIKTAKMALNHVLKYPKCILTQKGRFLFIFEVFGVIWMHRKAVFSENINLSKNRFQGRFYSAAIFEWFCNFP